MTIPSSLAAQFGAELPSSDEQTQAGQLREVIASVRDGGTLTLRHEGESVPVTLTPALSEVLLSALRPLSRGDAVLLIPMSRMLTTQQAADVLNVSRPFLIKLLERGEMPFETVGRHRRIEARDVFAFKRRRDEERARALSELARIDAHLI